jgi:P27 family predicted phage terminase small subunit
MGRRGTPRTPTKILAMRGSWRAKHRDAEPTPPPLAPRAPAWLDAEGKKLWRLWWKRLSACGMLTQVDEVAFARYCQTLARWIKMELFIQKHGEVYPLRNATGAVTSFAIFPQVGIYLRLSDQLCRMEAAFGLTPASRASVQRQDAPAHGNSTEHKNKTRFFIAG